MDRGLLGTMTAATDRDDESYLDFVEGLRANVGTRLRPVALAAGARAAEAHEQATGATIRDVATLRQVMDGLPVIASRNRMMRSIQEMMWNGIGETYAKRRDELIAALDAADRRGPGTVEWDPYFQYPAYFDTVDFHIQPGSYHDEALAGFIYHYGIKIFTTGADNHDASHKRAVTGVPVPADGQVRRVLDLACSIGQSTTAFKDRFPHAEVWGIDVAAPMIRYGHYRAANLGIDVHFKQALAEDTTFPDNSFDLVWCSILFHELPGDVRQQVVHEMHRILRPGGLFVIQDFPNMTREIRPGWAEYVRDFDEKENGEPYSSDFVYSDFGGLLRSVFPAVDEPASAGMTGMRICTK